MATTSRIFVRNLPPSLQESEFKSHFSTIAPITDAKFIQRRRIGYVGYKSPEAAAKAVKYFNKSFIRMSKIAVELARSPEELSARNNASDRNNGGGDDIVERPAKKAKLDVQDTHDPKLKEFLEVMQPSKKSRTWADSVIHAVPGEAVDEPVSVAPQEDKSDDEYEEIPKKREREIERESTERLPEQVVSHNDSPDGVTEARNDVQTATDAVNQPVQHVEATSDADWRRNHTSRLLGLLDDDEYDAPTATRQSPPSEKGAVITKVTAEREAGSTDAASGTEEEPVTTETETRELRNGDNNPVFADTGRLFVRNLSYDTREDDLRQYFEGYGPIDEVHIPLDTRSGASKGIAFVQFSDTADAFSALEAVDGKSFHGRLLHVLRAAAKKENKLDEYAISKLSHKEQQQIRRKHEASTSTFNWNTLYMNPDAVLSSIADRLGVAKSEILDPTSSGAAVKQAHAETNVIQETKAYFSSNGVNLDSLRKSDGDTVILVKNFSYGTTPEEIRNLFESHGSLKRLLMPPSGTVAIVEMETSGQAKAALRSLAYAKFRESVLLLQPASKDIFSTASKVNKSNAESTAPTDKLSAIDLLGDVREEVPSLTSTLFIRNLNFSTTSARLHETFKPLAGFMSASVKTKTDPKRPGQVLSMGFGFVEFRTKKDAQNAQAAMSGYRLDGHDLLVKASHKAVDAAEERRKEDVAKKLAIRRTKIIIKNLPFETTKKDVQQLFGPYGKLRSVRLPKKFDHSTRGFAFAEFVTAKEAENAMDALANSHLLGRRLNLQFASDESVDPEEEIEKMSKKVGRQTDKIALQRLAGSGQRRKFTVNNEGDGDVME